MKLIKSLALFTLTWLSLSAMAKANDCSSPDGTTGEIIFNDTHKVMQYCNGTNWIAMVQTPTSVPDGNKGSVIVSNNGETWTLKNRTCPTGWSLNGTSTFCYSPIQAAKESHQSQQVCAVYPYANTCSIGEYYIIESSGAQRWSQYYCSGTQAMMVQVGSGWNCVDYRNYYQFRCCMPNPANFTY